MLKKEPPLGAPAWFWALLVGFCLLIIIFGERPGSVSAEQNWRERH